MNENGTRIFKIDRIFADFYLKNPGKPRSSAAYLHHLLKVNISKYFDIFYAVYSPEATNQQNRG